MDEKENIYPMTFVEKNVGKMKNKEKEFQANERLTKNVDVDAWTTFAKENQKSKLFQENFSRKMYLRQKIESTYGNLSCLEKKYSGKNRN